MDFINQSIDNNVNIQQNRLQELLKKKWVLGIVGILVLAALLLPFLLPGKTKPEMETKLPPTIVFSPTSPFSPEQLKAIDEQRKNETKPFPTALLSRTPSSQSTSSFTPEQLKAIDEQRTADEAVGNREIEIKTNYPWFIKLPARGEKYFVYFEPNRKVFVGLLYPKSTDNVAQMKVDITKQLKDVYGIPVEIYTFEWRVYPQ